MEKQKQTVFQIEKREGTLFSDEVEHPFWETIARMICLSGGFWFFVLSFEGNPEVGMPVEVLFRPLKMGTVKYTDAGTKRLEVEGTTVMGRMFLYVEFSQDRFVSGELRYDRLPEHA